MLRHEVQELRAAHTRMQQTVARLSDNAEDLATAQAANDRYKKHIAEQDARALRIDTQHKKYVEGMGKSFSSLQDSVQAFVVQMLDTAAEQLVEAKEARDTNKTFLAERDAGHKDCVRELTESFDAKLAEQINVSELAEIHTRSQLTESFDIKLAEQIKASELAEIHTRSQLTESFDIKLAEQIKASELADLHTRAELTESFDIKLAEQIKASQLAELHTRSQLTESFDAKLTEQIKASQLAELHTRSELTESFDAKLADQIKASKLAEMHTRSELDLVSQELLGFKQAVCLPLPVSESLDIWNEDEDDDAQGCTVQSIQAFLDPYQDAVDDDEITRVLAAAACGNKRSVDNGASAGLCTFELQAMVYPNAGDSLFTSKAAKGLEGQQAGPQTRTKTPTWSPPPRECVLLCAFVLVYIRNSDLTRALSICRGLQVQGRRPCFLQVP